MQIVKEGKLPVKIYFTCVNCGCEFICDSYESCVTVVPGMPETWQCTCPTKGCCTNVYGTVKQKENDTSKYDPSEESVTQCLKASVRDCGPHDGNEYRCPYCGKSTNGYALWYLKKSKQFENALVCDRCHKPFRTGGF